MARKAQSATEYLMTYGWAILAITIVGGLLYLYVFQERACGSTGASGFPQVQGLVPSQNEFAINSSNALAVLVENRVGKDITVTKVEGPTGVIDIADVSIEDGESAVLFVSGFVAKYQSGKCYSHTTSFSYLAQDSTIEQKSVGTLNGKY